MARLSHIRTSVGLARFSEATFLMESATKVEVFFCEISLLEEQQETDWAVCRTLRLFS